MKWKESTKEHEIKQKGSEKEMYLGKQKGRQIEIKRRLKENCNRI